MVLRDLLERGVGLDPRPGFGDTTVIEHEIPAGEHDHDDGCAYESPSACCHSPAPFFHRRPYRWPCLEGLDGPASATP
jgi:hypothetical protein